MPVRTLFIAAVMLTLFAGCGGRSMTAAVPSQEEDAAANLLKIARNTNEGLVSFKGLGTLTILQNGASRTARAAWIGRFPDRLRFEIFGLPGQPGIAVSADGRWLYLRSGNPPEIHKKRMRGSDLASVLSMPVSVEDLCGILAGKVPIRSHTSLSLEAQEEAGGAAAAAPSLGLRSFWGALVERITWNASDPEPVAAEIFYPGENGAVRIRFDQTKSLEGFRVPERLTITDGASQMWIRLKMDRFWVNPVLDSSVFTLVQ